MPSDASVPPRAGVPRCGDSVFHRPTGETWLVAYCDGDELAWAGWPEGFARLSDCEVTRRCTDEEHRKAVDEWRGGDMGSYRRRKVLAMYGKEPPDA